MTETEQRIDEAVDVGVIEARAAAATSAPWHIEEHWDSTLEETSLIVCGPEPRGVPRQGIAEAFGASSGDAAFIAAARADVPALVAEVRRLRAEVVEAEQATAEFGMLSAELGRCEGDLAVAVREATRAREALREVRKFVGIAGPRGQAHAHALIDAALDRRLATE